MECKKCKASVSEDSKFCDQCGTEIDRYQSDLDKSLELCRRMWFILGFLKGNGSSGKKKKKWFIDLEKNIKEKIPEIWEEYQDAIDFWHKQSENSEDEKKTGKMP